MEKFKSALAKFFFNQNQADKSGENKFDHIISIEDIDGRRKIKRVTPSKIENKKPNSMFSFFMDVFFRCFICLLWAIVFSFFVRLLISVPFDKNNLQEYLYITGCFMIMLIVSITSIQFETLFIRLLDKFIPKVAVVVKQNPRKSYILRIRISGDKEFIETELDENKLTYNDLVELCCAELNLEKEKVARLWKVPETRIRGDADVKRFRRLEYLEIHT